MAKVAQTAVNARINEYSSVPLITNTEEDESRISFDALSLYFKVTKNNSIGHCYEIVRDMYLQTHIGMGLIHFNPKLHSKTKCMYVYVVYLECTLMWIFTMTHLDMYT